MQNMQNLKLNPCKSLNPKPLWPVLVYRYISASYYTHTLLYMYILHTHMLHTYMYI
jgi:uncharacterized membrane protein